MVIGYGSVLRGDDAVGRRVAEIIGRRKLRDVAAVSVHQLTPELAEIVARCEVAIFVDAVPADVASRSAPARTPRWHRARDARADRGVRIEPLAPAASPGVLAHTGAPVGLVALARAAYGRAPRSYAVTLPVVSFAFGARLSSPARRAVADAVQLVQHIVRESAGADSQAIPAVGRRAERPGRRSRAARA